MIDRVLQGLGWLALGAFVLALLGFGAALPGYAAVRHPVALLGAQGVPHALGFNLLGLVLPGVLAMALAVALLRRLPQAGWRLRIGGQLLLLSGLGLAAMGLLPLDAEDLDGPASRLHASAWLLWLVAGGAGLLLSGLGLRAQVSPALGWRALACAGVVLAAALWPWPMPALAQRVAFVAWLAWLALAGWALPRLDAARG